MTFFHRSGCDLLSFQYLCNIGNSETNRLLRLSTVVICSHFSTFVIQETAMWWYTSTNQGCDLLSFQYLCNIGNSEFRRIPIDNFVVICSHFSTFVIQETAPLFYDIKHLCCDLLSFQYLCNIGNSSDTETSGLLSL